MKIETSTTTELLVTEIKSLDPVSIYLEDVEPSSGKIIIECYGKSWSAVWRGMGGNTIAEFFVSCDNAYIAGNLGAHRRTIPDLGRLNSHVKKHIAELRRNGELDSVESRELFNEVDEYNFSDYSSIESLPAGYMQKVYGDEWWYDVPEIENPAYLYLCRIIDVARDALSIHIGADHDD